MQNKIYTIFGKKGGGKSTLTKELIMSTGGKVIYLSPVEDLKKYDYEIWDNDNYIEEISLLQYMKMGDIALVRVPSVEALDVICLVAMSGKSYTIIVDEIEMYQGSKQFHDIIHYGRHSETNIIANTRRYSDVPRLLTSQTNILFCFRITEPTDVDYLRKYVSSDFSEIVKNLPEYHYCNSETLQIKSTKFPTLL